MDNIKIIASLPVSSSQNILNIRNGHSRFIALCEWLRHALPVSHYPNSVLICISAWECSDWFSLGVFAKLRIATISFVMSVRPSIRMVQLGSHRTDFHEIFIFKYFSKTFPGNSRFIKI
jgi:hypothetical protein